MASTINHQSSQPAAVIRLILSCIILVTFLYGCASLPKDYERTESSAFTNTTDTWLGRRFRDDVEANPGQSGVRLLDSGLDAFVARVVLTEKAERSIDAQYFLYHSDQTGLIFSQQLVKAANRGVRVRLLVDDMDLGGRDLYAAVLDHHPNVEVRLFNPFSRNYPRTIQLATRFGKVTRRMHNKSFTVDRQISVVGGRNIGDEYFDASQGMNFSDVEAVVIGPVVAQVSSSFDKYWNSELSYPVDVLIQKKVNDEMVQEKLGDLQDYITTRTNSNYLDALRLSNLASLIRKDDIQFDWGDVIVVSDQPEKISSDRDAHEYHMAPGLIPYFRNVQSELTIISPYFVPGKAGTAFLQDLASSGIRVRILTNSLASTDVAVVHAGYAKYRKRLLRAGVEIYEGSPQPGNPPESGSGWGGSSSASLHTKSYLFDRRQVFIGSLNLDPRSVRENTEIGMVIDSADIANEMVNWFDDFTQNNAYRLELQNTWIGGQRIRWHEPDTTTGRVWSREPESGLMRRLGTKLIRFLPIESQL